MIKNLEGILLGELLGYNDGKLLGSDEGIKLCHRFSKTDITAAAREGLTWSGVQVVVMR